MGITLKKLVHPVTGEEDLTRHDLNKPIELYCSGNWIEFYVVGCDGEAGFAIEESSTRPELWQRSYEQKFSAYFSELPMGNERRYLHLCSVADPQDTACYEILLASRLRNIFSNLPEGYLVKREQVEQITQEIVTATDDTLILITGPISAGKSTTLKEVQERLAKNNEDHTNQIVIVINLEPAKIREIFKEKGGADGNSAVFLRQWIEGRVLESMWKHSIADDRDYRLLSSVTPTDLGESEDGRSKWIQQPSDREYMDCLAGHDLINKLHRLRAPENVRVDIVFCVDELDRLDGSDRDGNSFKHCARTVLKQLIWGVLPAFPKRKKMSVYTPEKTEWWCETVNIIAVDRADAADRWRFEALYTGRTDDEPGKQIRDKSYSINLLDEQQVKKLLNLQMGDWISEKHENEIVRDIRHLCSGNPLLIRACLALLESDLSQNRTGWDWDTSFVRIRQALCKKGSHVRRALDHIEGCSADAGVYSQRLSKKEEQILNRMKGSNNAFPISDQSTADKLVKLHLVIPAEGNTYKLAYFHLREDFEQ